MKAFAQVNRPGRSARDAARACGVPPAARLLALGLVLLAPSARAQDSWEPACPPPTGFDRTAAAAETLDHLSKLIALDTRNPPGNEERVALYLEAALSDVEGVTTHVLPAGEGRANFLAHLHAASPSGRPVLVLGHMDTVGAQEEAWSTPPLEPTLRDGYLYGRGAIDDKGMLAAATTALRALAAQRDALSRDVILLATAAEEGGEPVGVDRVIEQHRELLADAEFALNEGGRVRIIDRRVRAVNVQTTEKLSYNVRLTAAGPSGHGSVPLPDNALAALARACARLHDWRAPIRLNATTRLYFSGLASIERDERVREDMLALVGDDPELGLAAGERLARSSALHNAVLRSAGSLTLLEGGIRSNVIPSSGTANFNVRALPDDDIHEVIEAMRVAAGEPSVHLELVGEPKTAPAGSSVETALYRALSEAATTMAPEAVVMPFMSTGATDGAALRAAGIPTYGILPFPMVMEDELRMHGDDERVPVRALGWGTELLYRTLAAAAR
jgi:acetylornithine deacetylase/succinyl-diaminopimelate desuccinylase-like protein